MDGANEAQRTYWNSAVGERWATADEDMGALLAAAIPPILERADLRPGGDVLDIGCGSGALTVAAARRVAPGRVTGVDLSRPLLALARERIAASGLLNAGVLEADAEDEAFPAEGTAAIVSRFGMMFFADPVRAFRNLRRALRPEGRMSFAGWGPVADNPWFLIPREAAVARLGPVEPADPRAPGPFAFADADYLAGLLAAAGFVGITVDPVTVTLRHDDFAAITRLATVIGPASVVLRERGGTAADVEAVGAAIAAALEPFRDGEGVAIPAVLHVAACHRA
jgi:SAM-dependent methyltransferase